MPRGLSNKRPEDVKILSRIIAKKAMCMEPDQRMMAFGKDHKHQSQSRGQMQSLSCLIKREILKKTNTLLGRKCK